MSVQEETIMQKVKQIIALLLVILTLLGIVAPIVFGETVPGEIIIQDDEDLLSAGLHTQLTQVRCD